MKKVSMTAVNEILLELCPTDAAIEGWHYGDGTACPEPACLSSEEIEVEGICYHFAELQHDEDGTMLAQFLRVDLR